MTKLKHLYQFKTNQELLFQNELPIRYTKILKMLTCPAYLEPTYFEMFQPLTRNYLQDVTILLSSTHFTDTVHKVRANHDQNMIHFTNIIKNNHLAKVISPKFLETFYILNMSSRLLMDEHLSLMNHGTNIVQSIDPVAVAIDASQKAREIALRHDITPPEIHVINATGEPLSTLYIRQHLEYILVELLKNGILSSQSSKHILKLVIASGDEDVTFQLQDQGGGMALSQANDLWNLDPTLRPPFAKGLPLCRVMARYFGGDVELIPMQGHGNTSYLHLFKQDALEHIPELSPINLPVINEKSRLEAQIAAEEDVSWLLKLL